MNKNEILKGYIVVCKPGEKNAFVYDIKWNKDMSENEKKEIFTKIIKYTTNSENGKMSNMGLLPSPLNNCTAFINFDQFDPNTKYNFNIFGNPIFGNITFLGVDTNSKDGNIIPLTKKEKNNVIDFCKHTKDLEKKLKIYDSVNAMDKNKFLKDFIDQVNSVVEENAKKSIDEEIKSKDNIEKDEEELIKANKELKELE